MTRRPLGIPALNDTEGSLLGLAFGFADGILGFALFQKLGSARGADQACGLRAAHKMAQRPLASNSRWTLVIT